MLKVAACRVKPYELIPREEDNVDEVPREREEVESYMRVFDWDTFCMTNVTVDPFSLFIDVQVVSSSLVPLGTFYHSRLK